MKAYKSCSIIEGIMVKNRPNNYIADKSGKFFRDVRFGLLIKKKYNPTRNSNPDACYSAKKRGRKGGGGGYIEH